MKRVRDAVPPHTSLRAYEQAFVVKLGAFVLPVAALLPFVANAQHVAAHSPCPWRSSRSHNVRVSPAAGEHGSVETVMALLKETPLLRMIAETITNQAASLSDELVCVSRLLQYVVVY